MWTQEKGGKNKNKNLIVTISVKPKFDFQRVTHQKHRNMKNSRIVLHIWFIDKGG